MATNDNKPAVENTKIPRTYTLASGALEKFEDFVADINKHARARGVKNIDRGDVVSFLFNKCPLIAPEEYFNEPVPKKGKSKR